MFNDTFTLERQARLKRRKPFKLPRLGWRATAFALSCFLLSINHVVAAGFGFVALAVLFKWAKP